MSAWWGRVKGAPISISFWTISAGGLITPATARTFTAFEETGRKFTPGIALLRIGAYHPESFRRVHIGPDDAVRAFKDLRAKYFVPMHYGTFKLSFEELDEPPRWLMEIAEAEKLTSQIKILDEGVPKVF